MVQNHLFQLLALTAMEAPVRMNGEAVRDEKVKILSAIRPLTPHEVAACTVRGQYAAGGGEPGYRQEAGVAPDSQTETYSRCGWPSTTGGGRACPSCFARASGWPPRARRSSCSSAASR